MYEDYFGFKEKPFNIAPDPDYLYLSRKHQNAISSLNFGLLDDTGLLLFTGDIGTGKTTLIHHLLRGIGPDCVAAVVFNTNVDADQLLGIILQEFGLNADSDNKAVVVKALARFLTDQRTRKKRPLLIVDEAQSLSLEALEEIRLLSNLQDGTTMLLQIMLVGQPELKYKLQSPAMASLSQRIAVNYHLKPFEREETAAYIAHRLTAAGGGPDLFTEAAVGRIHQKTRGIPRSINLLCHSALVYAFADDLTVVDLPVVEEVLADTRESGLATLPGEAAAEAEEGGEGPCAPPWPAEASPDFKERLQRIETRIAAVETRLDQYGQDLREGLNMLVHMERSRSDKLLVAYTRLRTRCAALTKELAACGAARAAEPQEGPADEPSRRAKMFSVVSEPDTGTRGDDS